MKNNWTEKKPTEPGWYWYEDENYGPAPVLVEWTGFVEMVGVAGVRQLEVTTACGDECYWPTGDVDFLEGQWSSAQIEEPQTCE